MDELFRMTPAERRHKRLLIFGAAGVVVILVLVITAIRVAPSVSNYLNKRAQPVPPVAYLVALAPNTRVSLNGKITPLDNSLAIFANTTIVLPAGVRVAIVNPNGYIETLDNRTTLSFGPATPPQPDDDSLDFFISPREKLVGAIYNGPRETTGRVLVTSPFGVTRYTNPIITWEPRPGIRYDIAVVDPDDPESPPRVALNMLPPVRVDQLDTTQERTLTTDRNYNVIIRETGSETQIGGMHFLVAPDATDAALPIAPAELLLEAVRALTTRPARTGDGWLALSRLPADWADTELALRLRMRAAAELGLFDEIEGIQQRLAARGARN